jgi:hypothetical protein
MSEMAKELAELRTLVEALQRDREAREAAERRERQAREAGSWTRWVALWIVFLAVATALASQQDGAFGGKAMRALTQATNKWEYHNAISIKLHMFERERAKLLVRPPIAAPAAAGASETERRYLEEKIAWYRKRKPEVASIASQHDREAALYERHRSELTMALAILQVAIAVSAVAALGKNKPLWFLSMSIGAFGVFQTFNGIFLWIAA